MPCTIISYYPRSVIEHIPTFNPGQYIIPEGPAAYKVPEGVFYTLYLNDGKTQRIPVDNKQLGEEIVRSFQSSLEEVTDGFRPAVVVVDGVKTVAEFEQEAFKQMVTIKGEQQAWFNRLVQRADDSWQVKRQHRFITDCQKMAAKALGLKREWATVRKAEDMIDCPACGSHLTASVAICYNCNCIVNPDRMKDLKFVGQKAS